jgi:mannosyl-oligosaccharide alpha-1,3-glucosidase
MQFPEDEHGFAIDNQFYLGTTGILVHPVTSKDTDSVDVYLAEDEVFLFLSCADLGLL